MKFKTMARWGNRLLCLWTCVLISSLVLSVSAFTPTLSYLETRTRFVLNQSSRSYDSDTAITLPVPTLKKTPAAKPSVTLGTDLLRGFSKSYSHLAKEHYLLLAFLQAGFLASGADAATQTLEGAGPIDFGHVAAMATVASTMSGAMNAVWLRQLEQAFPGTATKEVATKTLIHAVILASIINSAYLAGVPFFKENLFSGTSALPPMDLAVIFQGWNLDEFITLTKLEVLMFIPYNTLAFKFVPPSVRPLTHASISATFNVAVSAVTLGYFDTWCHRAMHLFGSL